MKNEMTRRTFLKTTAAAALAVSLSGMLAGCSGEEQPMATVQLTGFEVNLQNVNVVGGDVYGEGKENLKVTVSYKLKYTGNGFAGAKYSDVFGAKIGDTKLNLTNGGMLFSGNWAFGREQNHTAIFEVTEQGVNTLFKKGTPLTLTVKPQSDTAKFTYDCKKKVTAAVENA